MFFVSATTYAQKDISVQLSIVSRHASAARGQEAGLLLNVKNQTTQNVAGVHAEAVSFTLIKAGEHYQDFCNISFLYQQRGDYKIVLELPPLDLKGVTCQVGTFRVREPGRVNVNELYLHVP
ncbi:hypothetical protein Slin_4199 [Spirosoma linguale DSM 74]|uniref:Uncharacterized protein n=2 Tax=Spirosoma TaxID=107 RepID=D2QKL8_SPILD|nr:hypothetical protein Slin_4199 [Spirosoma linguale DSM 74]